MEKLTDNYMYEKNLLITICMRKLIDYSISMRNLINY